MENSGVAPPLHLFAFHLKGSLSPQGSGMVMVGGVSPTQVKFKPDDLDLKYGHCHGGAFFGPQTKQPPVLQLASHLSMELTQFLFHLPAKTSYPHLAISAGGIYQWALQTRNDPGKSIVKTGISNLGNHHIFRLGFRGMYLGILPSISYSCGSPSGGHIEMKSVQSVAKTKPRKIQQQIFFHKPTICHRKTHQARS